jgi:hypothetical protein
VPTAVSLTTAFGIFLGVLMALGYVAIWALWHFVFRHAPPDDPQERLETRDEVEST